MPLKFWKKSITKFKAGPESFPKLIHHKNYYLQQWCEVKESQGHYWSHWDQEHHTITEPQGSETRIRQSLHIVEACTSLPLVKLLTSIENVSMTISFLTVSNEKFHSEILWQKNEKLKKTTNIQKISTERCSIPTNSKRRRNRDFFSFWPSDSESKAINLIVESNFHLKLLLQKHVECTFLPFVFFSRWTY